MAAKLLGMHKEPWLRLDHMTGVKKRGCLLADNKLALNSGWDEGPLVAVLGALMSEDLDFDVELIGFSISDTGTLMEP